MSGAAEQKATEAARFQPCEGGCTCGQIRYRVEAAPFITHACHCTFCQRQTGGPHVINALIEAGNVTVLQGEVETLTLPTGSGAGQVVARCPECRIAVWSNYLVTGFDEHLLFLRVGTLDDAARIPPDIHIYTASKQPWYLIPPDHMAVAEDYDNKEVWSAENIARIRAWSKTLPPRRS